jgi:hypothetical protein
MRTIYFTNGNGTGPAAPHQVQDGISIGAFFADLFPEGNPNRYVITVNGNPVAPNYTLREGDNVIFQERTNIGGSAAPTPAPTPVPSIEIQYLNTDTQGFTTTERVVGGTLYSAFLRGRRVDANRSQVRIRSRGMQSSINPPSDYVLRDGDLLTVTPTNISGA